MVMGGLYTHIPNTVLRTFRANKYSLFLSVLYVPGSIDGDMETRSGIKDTLEGVSVCIVVVLAFVIVPFQLI